MIKMTCHFDLRDLRKKVDELDKKMRNKLNRKACRDAGKPLIKNLRADVKKWDRSSLWQKATKQKVKLYQKGAIAVAIVGFRNDFVRQVRTVKRGKNIGKPVLSRPSKIAHLIERGTKERISKSGKRSGRMPALPFMGPAIARSKAAIKQAMIRSYITGLAGLDTGGSDSDD